MHVERGRIGGADPFKSSLAAPEFHAALEVRVENHMFVPPPQRPPCRSQLLLMLSCYGRADKGEVRKEGECD